MKDSILDLALLPPGNKNVTGLILPHSYVRVKISFTTSSSSGELRVPLTDESYVKYSHSRPLGPTFSRFEPASAAVPPRWFTLDPEITDLLIITRGTTSVIIFAPLVISPSDIEALHPIYLIPDHLPAVEKLAALKKEADGILARLKRIEKQIPRSLRRP